MTVKEKILSIVDKFDCEVDDWNKLVGMAYYIGKEQGVKEISDKYTALLAEQRKRADKCRYNKMAHKVIGDVKYIYHPDYSGDMIEMFGNDEIKL